MNAAINIGRTIARERRRMGVTQEILADHLGVSKAAISKWELGQSLPDVALLPRIAAYFSLTLDELFDWHDELTDEACAEVYAEVYALGAHDVAAAHERLRALASEHYSDVNLLLMLASLLTVWAAGMTTPFSPADEGTGTLDAAMLTNEALALLDRVLEVASEPSTLFLAQQQKATALFQIGKHEEAAALLEPLVHRQDASASTMLLASAYRKLDRDNEALELLQAERLRAASFVLSSLMQEVGMRDDAAFARAAGDASEAVFKALDMGSVNPLFMATMSLEVAETLRRTGEKEGALDALACAVDAVDAIQVHQNPSDSSLWDHMAGRLDPAQAGEAWAEHKASQADEAIALMRQAIAERVSSPEWRELIGDDSRFSRVLG
ncbi:helix-turn-helix transcriptional regulator [uncultured Enorma sp.]|uniref:helix-turn-helix domain-containing protein n=1 Tax=uncultured Enorma sp. TaxID=1714346 RepID=UPI002803D9EA|nr:helix-turn-helix transcriptional regulator [uncultured Enorma sp.]